MLKCKKVIMASKVYLSITAETYSFPDIETGGIFLGKVIKDVWYINEVIDPGYNDIIRSSAYFEYDANYVTHLANVKNRLYLKGIDLLGLWHRHPGGFDRFSATDDETNIRFAKLHPFGAVSAIINLDPDFRITMYHVSLPIQYAKVKNVIVGDSYIPKKLFMLKRPDDFIKKQNIEINTGECFNSVKRTFSNSKHKEIQPVINQDLAMEILESELDTYLERQTEYSYDMAMAKDSVKIKMIYLGKMSYYPQEVNCIFYADEKQKYCVINNQKFIYTVGILKKFIDKFINDSIAKGSAKEKMGVSKKKVYLNTKELEKVNGFDLMDVKQDYRSKMKGFYQDTFDEQ